MDVTRQNPPGDSPTVRRLNPKAARPPHRKTYHNAPRWCKNRLLCFALLCSSLLFSFYYALALALALALGDGWWWEEERQTKEYEAIHAIHTYIHTYQDYLLTHTLHSGGVGKLRRVTSFLPLLLVITHIALYCTYVHMYILSDMMQVRRRCKADNKLRTER